MDQLKGVMKFGFWIGCGVIAIGTLGVGFWTASNLAKERDSQISKIEAEKTSMSTIQSNISTHPNDATKNAMEKLIEQLKTDVAESWTKQYDTQKDLLVWPADELGQDFVDAFKDFVPIELTVEYPVTVEKEIGLLNRYRDYIGEVLPDIAKIAGAEWTADFKNASGAGMGSYGGMGGIGGLGGEDDDEGGAGLMGGGGYPGASGGYPGASGGYPGMSGSTDGLKEQPLVRWEKQSQERLMANLFPWRGRTPNTLEVLYSQENLWVLRQLMEVVAAVNGDAKQPFQAVIREINDIAIGRAASQLGGGAMPGGGMGMGGMGGYYGGSDPSGMMGGEDDDEGSAGLLGGGGLSGGGAAAAAVDPADMRYVDVNYEPMDAATLRSKMASSSPDDAYTTVAKRIPVRLNVRIDQRKIPTLVAECGNAALMIEVIQVRINPSSSSAGGGYGGMGSAGGMGMGMGGAGGMGMGGAGGMGMGGAGGMGMGMGEGASAGGGYGGAGGAASEFPNETTVEVSGIVYIYNPPEMEKLGIEAVDENTLIEGDTETVSGEAVAPPTPAFEPEVPDVPEVPSVPEIPAADASNEGTVDDSGPASLPSDTDGQGGDEQGEENGPGAGSVGPQASGDSGNGGDSSVNGN